MIRFDATKEDAQLIAEIAVRALDTAQRNGLPVQIQDIGMDVTAAHLNGNPLRLADLLDANDSTFGHDVFGIMRYLDRRTGKPMNCFIPRMSAREGD